MIRPMRASERLVGIFIITSLAPGLILGVLGPRALLQEKERADQQIRERLSTAAESGVRRLELEFGESQDTVNRLALTSPSNREAWRSGFVRQPLCGCRCCAV